MNVCRSLGFPLFPYSKKQKAAQAFLTVTAVAFLALGLYAHFYRLPSWKRGYAFSFSALSVSLLALPQVACEQRGKSIFETEKRQASKNKLSLLHFPQEILFAIFVRLGSLEHQGRLSLVCKKFYLLNQMPQGWALHLERLYPTLKFPLDRNPIATISKFSKDMKKIKKSFPDEILYLFGGSEGIYSLPETHAFQNQFFNAQDFSRMFYLYSDCPEEKKKRVREKRAEFFGKHPIVKGWDKLGNAFLLAHYLWQKDTYPFNMILYISIQRNPQTEQVIQWGGSTLISQKACHQMNEQVMSWHKEFFSGKKCRVSDVLHLVDEDAVECLNDQVQLSVYSK